MNCVSSRLLNSVWLICLLTWPVLAQIRPQLVQSWANKTGLNLNSADIQADRNGTIWLASDDGLIQYQKGQFRVFHGIGNQLSDDYVRLTIRPNGQPWLWGGGTKRTLLYFDANQGKVVRMPDSSRIVRDFTGQKTCQSLLADQNGFVWVGLDKGGVLRYDPQTRTVTHVITEPVNLVGMAEDTKGQLWFASDRSGLWAHNPRTKGWQRFVPQPTNPAGLPTEYIGKMAVRRDGKILLGMIDQVALFDPQTGRCQRWQLHQHRGAESFLAYQFTEDSRGNVYFAAGTSTFRLSPEGQLDQLLTDAPTARIWALFVDNADQLWVSAADQLSLYDLRGSKRVAVPMLLDIVINGKAMQQPTPQYQLNWLRNGPVLSLPEGQNLTLHFAPGVEKQTYQYRYRLAGKDTDWTVRTNSSAEETYALAAGEYQLDVEGMPNNESSDRAASLAPLQTIRVMVRPPFWKTPWAMGLGALVVLATLGWVVWTWQRRQQLKRSLEKQATEAAYQRQLNEFKTTLFANVTHEFRTPLTLILNTTERLTNRTTDGFVRQSAEQIDQNAHQLLRLVGELMDIARSDAGKLVRHNTVGQPAGLIARVVGSMQALADKKAIRFHWEATGDTDGLYEFDGDKLAKITHNLLSNALKFTPDGGQTHVHCVLNETDGLTLTVSDTGIGIAPDQQERIFERFYQVNASATRAYEGTGLGLAFVRELVHLLEGRVTVVSQPDKGSTFSVWLPMQPALESSGQAAVSEPGSMPVVGADTPLASVPALPDRDSVDKPLLLLVEDNNTLRNYLAEELNTSYGLLLATDGQQGLALAQEHVPDLIVSDVMMPGMDGFELLEQLKTDHRTSHIPVILLTARASLDSRLQGLATGADDYLSKPFSFAELRYRIRNALQTRLNWQQYLQQIQSAGNGQTDTATESPVPPLEQQFVVRLRQLVLSHLTDDIDTNWLMSHTRLSRTQLHRKLTALTGQSVTHFVNGVRLDKARELLEAGAGNASEVAYLVGFKSPSYFTKLFKEHYGETPGQVKV